MRFSGIVLTMFVLLTFDRVNAQATGREINSNSPLNTRDSVSYRKKLIAEKYDSLINICRGQIVVLNLEFDKLQKHIENLKNQINLLNQDYNNWFQNSRRSPKESFQIQSQQKQKELDKKINDLNNQIYSTHKTINANEAIIKELKSKIISLEKEKAMALSKIK